MITYRVMPLEERDKITDREIELRRQGKYDEAMAVAKTRPLSPYLERF